MKRSKMIDIIEDCLLQNEASWPWDAAPLILNAIEKAGMSPPSYATEEYDHQEGYKVNLLNLGKWEPEND